MATLSETKELFRRAEAVCFDVDSTVIKEEGIDELAKFCGVGDAVTEMCVRARSTSHRDTKKHPCFFGTVSGFIVCVTFCLGPVRPWVDP